MNKLLNPISWSAYLETMAIIAIAYYAFVGWRYCGAEIEALVAKLTGKNLSDDELPAALQYQPEEKQLPVIVAQTVHTTNFPGHEQLEGPAKSLADRLQSTINGAADNSYAPAMLIRQLRKILNDYPEIAATPDREAINDLIVRECEKKGTALLGESEVDLWWSA